MRGEVVTSWVAKRSEIQSGNRQPNFNPQSKSRWPADRVGGYAWGEGGNGMTRCIRWNAVHSVRDEHDRGW